MLHALSGEHTRHFGDERDFVLDDRAHIDFHFLDHRIHVFCVVLVVVHGSTLLDDALQHFLHFLEHKWQRPREYIHVLRQHVRVMCVVELLYLDLALIYLNHCTLVVVHVAVVGRTEHCYH